MPFIAILIDALNLGGYFLQLNNGGSIFYLIGLIFQGIMTVLFAFHYDWLSREKADELSSSRLSLSNRSLCRHSYFTFDKCHRAVSIRIKLFWYQ